MSVGAGTIYGYVSLAPIILWAIFKWLEIPVTLLQNVCIYGYSLFVFLPVAVRAPLLSFCWFLLIIVIVLFLCYLFAVFLVMLCVLCCLHLLLGSGLVHSAVRVVALDAHLLGRCTLDHLPAHEL